MSSRCIKYNALGPRNGITFFSSIPSLFSPLLFSGIDLTFIRGGLSPEVLIALLCCLSRTWWEETEWVWSWNVLLEKLEADRFLAFRKDVHVPLALAVHVVRHGEHPAVDAAPNVMQGERQRYAQFRILQKQNLSKTDQIRKIRADISKTEWQN